ncbi:MAG: GMC family oxidoreductase [Myxococcota bacterium]
MTYESARDFRGSLTLDCDVVVVGSGASGAVIATELAAAGQSVIVLEEGPRIDAGDHGKMRPSESLRHVWRDGGMSVAFGVGDSPTINVTMGRVVGGSSVVTGGVCFRTPDYVLDTWANEHKLTDYAPGRLEEEFAHVEEKIHVEEVPRTMWSKSTELFEKGAEKKGFRLHSMKRNTQGCHGCGRCNFGCPEKAKLSVDLSYLPRAVKAGAQVWSHCLVETIRVRGGRASGVEGRLLNGRGGRPKGKLRVHARRVVVACGAWHTPQLLRKSGIRRSVLGTKMTLHPGFRMLARFPEDVVVDGWKGAMQGAYSTDFEKEGITLTDLFIPVSVIGATMPGFGPSHVRGTRRMRNIAMFGGIIHDEGGGTIRWGPGRDPIVTYRMAKEDRAQIPRILRLMGETFLEAGAEVVYPGVLGLEKGLDADAFRRFPFEQIPGPRFEASSQHPLGTARMGAEPSSSVVDANGHSWDIDELFVVDGSILPTSLGVNPQLSIMAIATRLAWRMRERRLA